MSDLTAALPAAGWLDEHLAFAVPLRMIELVAWAQRQPRVAELGWREILRRRLGSSVHPSIVLRKSSTGPAADVVTVATRGDTLTMSGYGSADYRPGAVTEVVAALTTSLATAALIAEGGVTFLGRHWCGGGCSRCAAQVVDEMACALDAEPTSWWAPLDALLADESGAA